MSTEQAQQDAKGQRDAKGQFALGNIGGPGNPFARQVSALRQALLNAVKPEDVQQIASALISKAKEGNIQAAKLLLAYAIGKPQPAPSPDRMDADEWDVYREEAPMQQEAPGFMKACDPRFYLNSVRVARPVFGEVMRNKVRDMFNETPEQRQAREAREAEEMERILKSPAPPFDWPSAKGKNGQPTAKGKKRRRQPSPNSKPGEQHPSANGKAPSPNGDLISACGDTPPRF